MVKPTRGEQGKGITVGVRRPAEELDAALARAREQHPGGADRAACAGRRPAAGRHRRQGRRRRAAHARRRSSGTGHHTVRELIEAPEPAARARRPAANPGSRVDDVTESDGRGGRAGRSDDVLPEGERLRVRRTANLHQGGTIHDVTAEVNPELCEVAVAAAEAIGIPVTGHRPSGARRRRRPTTSSSRPTSARAWPTTSRSRPRQAFVDFLFPQHPGLPQAWTPDQPPQ